MTSFLYLSMIAAQTSSSFVARKTGFHFSGSRSSWRGFYARELVKKSTYLLVSRQPAASASSTEQNQRVPLLICILIWAYQRLLVVW
jgi:hypothetical protein